MPKLKPKELESRRQEIIDAARTCFLRSGFHRTTTDDICREASITPGGLYHYFGGKDEIIAAVIQQSTNDVLVRLRAMLDAGDMQSAFGEVSSFLIESLHDPNIESVVRLDIEIWAEALKNQELYEISKQSWAGRRELMESFVKRGAEAGLYSMPEVDTRGLSSLLLAMLIGLRVGRVVLKDDFDLNGAITAMFLVHSGRLSLKMAGVNDLIAPLKPTIEPAAVRIG